MDQRELRLQGKDPATMRAHGMIIEPKSCEACDGTGMDYAIGDTPVGVDTPRRPCPRCNGTGRRIPPEIAERQRLTYQQIIDREA